MERFRSCIGASKLMCEIKWGFYIGTTNSNTVYMIHIMCQLFNVMKCSEIPCSRLTPSTVIWHLFATRPSYHPYRSANAHLTAATGLAQATLRPRVAKSTTISLSRRATTNCSSSEPLKVQSGSQKNTQCLPVFSNTDNREISQDTRVLTRQILSVPIPLLSR